MRATCDVDYNPKSLCYFLFPLGLHVLKVRILSRIFSRAVLSFGHSKATQSNVEAIVI